VSLTGQAENIRDNFSYSATFTPATGSPVTLRVEYLESESDQPVGADGTMSRSRREVTFLLADLAAEPNRDETFTIGGTAYKVKQVVQRDNWFMTVAVK